MDDRNLVDNQSQTRDQQRTFAQADAGNSNAHFGGGGRSRGQSQPHSQSQPYSQPQSGGNGQQFSYTNAGPGINVYVIVPPRQVYDGPRKHANATEGGEIQGEPGDDFMRAYLPWEWNKDNHEMANENPPIREFNGGIRLGHKSFKGRCFRDGLRLKTTFHPHSFGDCRGPCVGCFENRQANFRTAHQPGERCRFMEHIHSRVDNATQRIRDERLSRTGQTSAMSGAPMGHRPLQSQSHDAMRGSQFTTQSPSGLTGAVPASVAPHTLHGAYSTPTAPPMASPSSSSQSADQAAMQMTKGQLELAKAKIALLEQQARTQKLRYEILGEKWDVLADDFDAVSAQLEATKKELEELKAKHEDLTREKTEPDR